MKKNLWQIFWIVAPLVATVAFVIHILDHDKKTVTQRASAIASAKPDTPPEPKHKMTADEEKEFYRLSGEIDELRAATDKIIEKKTLRMLELSMGATLDLEEKK